MFARTFVIVTLAVAVAAFPAKRDTCSTGTLSCCNQVAPANQLSLTQLLPLGIQDPNAPVGIECTPIGLGGLATAGNWCVLTSSAHSCI